MINKQNLWLLTLLSLILILGVYYLTMPNDILKTKEKKNDTIEVKENKNIQEVSNLVAMRVSLEEERQNSIDSLQQQLVSEKLDSEEKNNVYEQLKYLNELQGKEESIEKKIKTKYNLDCFVKLDNLNAETICISDKHNNKIANNIMRLIQTNEKSKMFITVKFQPNKLKDNNKKD